MEKEAYDIRLCLELIEQSLRWGESQFWSNHDFENLSEKIFEKTQVRLSLSTLKRIWGKVKYESSPTLATLNTLARFLGFESWRDFQYQNNPGLISVATAEITEPAGEPVPVLVPGGEKGGTKKPLRSLIFTMLVITLGAAGILLSGKAKDTPSHPAAFKSRMISDDLPNSVVFDYDVSGFHAKEVFIQQSWDPAKRELVPANGKQHTSLYYFPGYFIAKLIVDGKIEKENPVFIKTRGWKGIINMRQTPTYLSDQEIRMPSGLGINSATMRRKLSSDVFNDNWVSVMNVRDFGDVRGDNFTVEASVRNTSTMEESVCRRVRIVILGKNSAIVVPLAILGCSSSIDLLTGDGWIYGKENDLSNFGCTYKDFENIKCTVKNNHIEIFLNKALIKTIPQHNFVGDIVGLRFEFEGAGEIKNVALSGGDKLVYAETFSH